MKSYFSQHASWFALSLIICLIGCNDGNVGQVSGTVHLDGKPLEGALVTFYPQSQNADPMETGTSIGRTDEKGNYELIYNRDVKGAVVGKHLVYIETLQEGSGYGPGRAEELPKRYNSQSELHVEVNPGRNKIDFMDLTSEGVKNKARPSSGRY